MRHTNLIRLVPLALAVSAIAAGPASASQVFMDPNGVDRIIAGGGENNDVTVDVLGPSTVKFTENDLQGVTQTNCQVQSAHVVICNQQFNTLQVTTGSFDDKITVNAANAKARVVINSGKDDDTVVVNGMPASETITGDTGEDDITGSDANSYITSGPPSTGGSDADVVHTGAGYNTVHGGDDGDHITGGSGKDTIYGEDGADTIGGSLGSDSLHGQLGNDWLDGLDGVFDTAVDCGPGTDTAYKDAFDSSNGCELP